MFFTPLKYHANDEIKLQFLIFVSDVKSIAQL